MLRDHLPADAQSAEVVVPAVGALNNPAARLLAADWTRESRLAPAADVGPDPASPRLLFWLGVVVPLVEADVLGTARPSRCPERNRVEGLADHVLVVDVGPGERHRQRDSLAVGQYMAFCAEFCTIGRIGPGELPPLGALTLALSSEAQSQSRPTFRS